MPARGRVFSEFLCMGLLVLMRDIGAESQLRGITRFLFCRITPLANSTYGLLEF